MAVQLQLRRGTASQWTTANPLLAQGEIGIETDTLKIKIGDGINAWTALAYYTAGAVAVTTVNGQTGVVTLTAADVGAIATETDPVYTASSWYSTTNNATNWDTAYTDRNKWDGGATGLVAATGRTSLGLGTAATTDATDYATAAQGAKADTALQSITSGNVTSALGYTPYNATNPAGYTNNTGTVTSVALTTPTGLSVTGSPVTTSGTLALSMTSGYAIPTTASQTTWDTAYGWGNHASAGYLTSSTAASTYAPLTGTGTSGTWGISITGNAATATNVAYSGLTGTVPIWNQNTTGTASNVTGTVAIANGGTGATTLAGASIVTYTGTETLSNKRIDPRDVSATTATSLTPSVATADIYAYTALATGLTINAPTGTPTNGDKLIFRFLDNGTSRALTWDATYTAIGVTIPSATTASKTTYVGCIYNANNTRWDVIAVATQA
jgi:hypothetical protein